MGQHYYFIGELYLPNEDEERNKSLLEKCSASITLKPSRFCFEDDNNWNIHVITVHNSTCLSTEDYQKQTIKRKLDTLFTKYKLYGTIIYKNKKWKDIKDK